VADVLHPQMILSTLRCSSPQDGDTKNKTEEGEGKTGMKIVDVAGDLLRRLHARLYIGSHNFSVTAWGALTPEREWVQPGTECMCVCCHTCSLLLCPLSYPILLLSVCTLLPWLDVDSYCTVREL
jgi:hypothetical protein